MPFILRLLGHRKAQGGQQTGCKMTVAHAHVQGARYAVTGAAGFIGSHLAHRLIEGGAASVVVIDSLQYGTKANIPASDRITFHQADLAELSVEQSQAMLAGCDVLLHFAAEKHNNSVDSPQRVIDANISGTYRLFEAAGRAGLAKVVFASSLYAYGRMAGRPMTEADIPEPATVYGMSKLSGEALLREAGRRFGFDHTTLRLFFTYGTRQYTGLGYPSVIVRNFERILAGQPPRINGNGEQVLDYINVADVVDAVLGVAGRRLEHSVFNVGSGLSTSINHLTEVMLEVSGSGLRPVHVEADWTEGTCRVGDASLLRAALGWQPQVDLHTGLGEVWTWLGAQNA